ncbi:MAG: iron complex transport system ATP-binding protein [Pseudonocardiales bacterium]|jgi:iron complex transport system ATP-binding protein|nr:iron complex transport system ATP-binding protein [Pseudonocardiales bacterium]
MLEIGEVSFAFTPGQWLFRDVSLTVAPGSVVAVLGPNGRGKTTLLRCAAGLLTPSGGTVEAGGAVGYVPQAHSSAFAYRVIDMVLMGRARHLKAYASPKARDHALAAAALERVGLSHLADRPFTAISGGERQLVLIARAVASGSTVLVLDEPAAALDLRNQGQVLNLLRDLAAEGMAILMTTHHPDHALYLADRVVLMMGPDDVRIGPADALLTDQMLSQLYQVRVRTISYDDEGTPRRVLATSFT